MHSLAGHAGRDVRRQWPIKPLHFGHPAGGLPSQLVTSTITTSRKCSGEGGGQPSSILRARRSCRWHAPFHCSSCGKFDCACPSPLAPRLLGRSKHLLCLVSAGSATRARRCTTQSRRRTTPQASLLPVSAIPHCWASVWYLVHFVWCQLLPASLSPPHPMRLASIAAQTLGR